MPLESHAPAGHIQAVHAVVPQPAVAEVREPVPVVVEPFAGRTLEPRAEPSHRSGSSVRGQRPRTAGSNRGPSLPRVAARKVNLPRSPRREGRRWPPGAPGCERRCVPTSTTRPESLPCLQDRGTLCQRVGRRLLQVEVLAGLQGPHRRQGMPVVRRGDDHGVDPRIIEDPSKVGHHPRARIGDVLRLDRPAAWPGQNPDRRRPERERPGCPANRCSQLRPMPAGADDPNRNLCVGGGCVVSGGRSRAGVAIGVARTAPGTGGSVHPANTPRAIDPARKRRRPMSMPPGGHIPHGRPVILAMGTDRPLPVGSLPAPPAGVASLS